MLADPINIVASSHKNRASVRRGKMYTLQVTLTLPAASRRRLEATTKRELLQAHNGKSTPVSTTNYAVLVTPPAGNAVAYRRTSVAPTLKPGSLRKPQVQTNGGLLWPTMPIHRYAAQASTRTLRVCAWVVVALHVGARAHDRA